ncbi:MAG TPA: signal peptidase II [Candidatus Limnocylindrales bacterium]|nr:signal peptidase II [Candidatus Limnocylindrales bacterium]
MTETHQERPPGRRRWALFAGLAAAVAVLDQLTKSWVEASFTPAWTRQSVPGLADPTPILGDLVRIAKTYNDGAIFGLFDAAAPILAAASLAVVLLLVVYHVRQGERAPWLLTVALGLLLGGALGNLVDRVRFGHVIDWVDAGIGDLRWYTFNVADAAVSLAIVGLLFIGLFGERRRPEPAPVPGPAAEPRPSVR